jgi:hypothetical protein
MLDAGAEFLRRNAGAMQREGSVKDRPPNSAPEPGPRAGLRELEPAAAGPRLLEQPAVESSKKREVTVKVVSVRPGMMKRTQSTDDCAKMKSVANE